MRRKDREVLDETIIEGILSTATVCRLALVDNGEPYLVPMSYGYRKRALFMHSAAVGRKMDILRRQARVCFEIEGPVELVRHPEACYWGVKARSIIGYGNVSILTERAEKLEGLDALMRQHGKQDANTYDPRNVESLVMLRLDIDQLSCKQLGKWD